MLVCDVCDAIDAFTATFLFHSSILYMCIEKYWRLCCDHHPLGCGLCRGVNVRTTRTTSLMSRSQRENNNDDLVWCGGSVDVDVDLTWCCGGSIGGTLRKVGQKLLRHEDHTYVGRRQICHANRNRDIW